IEVAILVRSALVSDENAGDEKSREHKKYVYSRSTVLGNGKHSATQAGKAGIQRRRHAMEEENHQDGNTPHRIQLGHVRTHQRARRHQAVIWFRGNNWGSYHSGTTVQLRAIWRYLTRSSRQRSLAQSARWASIKSNTGQLPAVSQKDLRHLRWGTLPLVQTSKTTAKIPL